MKKIIYTILLFSITCFGQQNKECCNTPLDVWNYWGTPDPLPTQHVTSYGQDVTIATETFELHKDALIPITELRVVITDMEFEYSYDKCAKCIDNPALWGSIFSSSDAIGIYPENLPKEILPYQLDNPRNPIVHNQNLREIIWSNKKGAMLKSGDLFHVSYLLPPASDIPCCVTSVKICTEISWKDANCNTCSIQTCSNVALVSPNAKLKELQITAEQEGCCKIKLIANPDLPATSYLWSNGVNTKEIIVDKNGSYTVTAELNGSSISQTYVVSSLLQGSFPTLSYLPQATPGFGSNFIIYDYTKPYNANYSYNANKYTLWVFGTWDTDRFNGALRKITGIANCEAGFKNGDIQWDGLDNSGKRVKSGMYNFVLRLENCDRTCESEKSTCNETHNYERWDNCAEKVPHWFPPFYKCIGKKVIKPQRIGVVSIQW